jgi:fatty acid desaturase
VAQITYFYRWLYYRCYRPSKKVDGKFAMRWANASLYVIMFLVLNLIVLLFLFGFVFHTTFGIPVGLPHWVIGSVFVGVVLIHHVFIRHGDRYKKIIGEFSKEGAEEERRGDRLFGCYFVLSMLAFVATCVVLAVRAG